METTLFVWTLLWIGVNVWSNHLVLLMIGLLKNSLSSLGVLYDVDFLRKRGQNIYFVKKGLADFYSSTMNTLHNFQKHNGHPTKTLKYLKVCI